MAESTAQGWLRQRFCTPRGVERDLAFRTVISRLIRRSMFIVGLLGVGMPVIYTVAQVLLFGDRLSWWYDQAGMPAVLVLWDKLAIVFLGLTLLALSQTQIGPRWGRLIMAITIVVASIATVGDDIARADLGLTAGWLALIMFFSTTLPFRAAHTFALCLGVIATYNLALWYIPDLTGWSQAFVPPDHLVLLTLTAVACTCISGLLYNSLFRQHEASQRLAAINSELRETQTQLVQSAKMASLGNLAAGIAHEINSPLGAIHSNAELSVSALEKLRTALDTIIGPSTPKGAEEPLKPLRILADLNTVTLTASARIDVIVKALRNFARLDEAERKRVDLHEGIESTLSLLNWHPGKDITIVRNFAELPPINCFPSQINQVLMNLLLNSIEAIERTGTIAITTQKQENWALIQVADTGSGISKEQQEHVFDPGYTTKGVGVGSGLGLAICYRIIESHRGQIDLSSEPGKGTVVTLRLPID